MQQQISALCLSVLAVGALLANRFVHAAGDQAVADENTLGVARASGDSGTYVPVDVLGTAIVEAGGSFSKGATLKSNVDGKAILWASSGAKVAIALEEGANGRLVEVLLIPNVA